MTPRCPEILLPMKQLLFSDGRQGEFWSQNHHRLRPSAMKASGLLDPAEHADFYYHFMRISGSVSSGELTSAKLLKARLKLIGQVGNYTSQPAQRDEKTRFSAFSADASHILNPLRVWGIVMIGVMAMRTMILGHGLHRPAQRSNTGRSGWEYAERALQPRPA